MSACRTLAPLVDTYVDGELSPSQLVEVEAHAVACPRCAERMALDRATRDALHRLSANERAPDALRARVAASMRAERLRASPLPVAPARATVRGMAPLAAAAALLFLAAAQNRGARPSAATPSFASAAAGAAMMDVDRVVDQFVDWHAKPLPPETTRAEDLPSFEPYVGVPVRAPRMTTFGARLVGGRILPVLQHERAAAMLQYTLGDGRRVSVYVYDPRRVRMAASQLHPHAFARNDAPEVWAGQVRGYSVATTVRRDVGYAVASDLDEDENVELAMASAP